MTRARFVRLLLLVSGFAALPYTIGATGGTLTVRENVAECDGGTCCPDTGTCYPNDCSTFSCASSNAYWRTDGKPCSFPLEP